MGRRPELARLGARLIFVSGKANRPRRGFKIAKGESVLVVEDVVTQGGRAKETIGIVRGLGGVVMGLAMVVDRSSADVNMDVPLFSLLKSRVETFPPDNLPPDLAGMPAIKPGST
jgi:orotate phosphoribosyltransferase